MSIKPRDAPEGPPERERNGSGRYGVFVVTPRRIRGAAALTCATFMSLLTFDARPADAGTLSGIRLDVSSGRNTRVILAFTNGTPTYKIFGNDTNDVSLILQSSARGVTAPTTVIGRDPLKSISVDNFGDSLNVTFHEAAPANITVAPGSGQTLLVTIAASSNGVPGPAVLTPPPIATPTPTPPQGEAMEIIRLKYADVSEVVGLLVAGQQIPSNDSFTPQEQQFGSSGLTGGATGSFAGGTIGGLNSPATQNFNQVQNLGGGGTALGQQINDNIGVDRRLNAIILTGTPDIIARFKAKIDKIDIPLSSVELETQIVELDDSAAKAIGIDFTNAGGPVAAVSYKSASLATAQGGITLQAAVYAQITKGLGRTIARPRITALDGTSAQIITGTQIPIVTSIAVSGVSAVSSQVQYINVGVSLQIQPRISPDGFVTSHIFSQVSSETGTSQNYPILSQREATTSATVKDGDSFVIGGLLQQNDISSVAKTPFLGDLPLVGGFFRNRQDQSSNTNLYIIVTPHILKNGANPPPARPLPSPLPTLPSITH